MTTFDAHEQIIAAFMTVAPDVDPDNLDADLHDDLGLDSMDLLNLAEELAKRCGIEILARDAPGLRTIRHLETYLNDHQP
jgi:acyl carrier protein